MSKLEEIALSGIDAARKHLEATANNIANAASPWYSRQQVVQAPIDIYNRITKKSDFTGVNVVEVRRLYNQAVVEQCWSMTGEYGFSSTFSAYSAQLEAFMGEKHSSFSAIFNEWIAAMSQSSSDPSIMAYRQQVLSVSAKLSGRMNYLYERLNSQADQANSQMSGIVAEANGLLESIAEFNEHVMHYGEQSSLGIRDERDQTVNRLSELLGVRVFEESTGALNMSFESGQNLVNGSIANKLEVKRSQNELFETDLYILANREQTRELVYDCGGEIGGLFSFLRTEINDTLDELGWQSFQIALTTNKVLKNGSDLKGSMGASLFSDMNNKTYAGLRTSVQNQKGEGEVFVYIEEDNLNDLKSDNYRLIVNAYDSAGINVYSERTGEVISVDQISKNKWQFEGLMVEIEQFDKSKNGDQFILRPCRDGSRIMGVVMDDAALLAFAAKGNGPGDNSNLEKLLYNLEDRQTTKGTLSFAYEKLTAKIANMVSEHAVMHEAIVSGKEAMDTLRSSISSVDMDDEASNLVRFQHYYQANSKVLVVQKEIINVLLMV